ncbi:NAD(P)-binding protein [Peribacillus butanolivorans]|nr:MULTISPECIES: NAD(P)-binding protein [unclassified Peribacillus]MBK5441898.1 NAD(P)-binding protein [Peribacillus sp. TH24]MBK5463324.1 NAD(P)-binding protein [Peribacillus sp. TH27]MBK5483322.1 NAD(P)-binding protein [Peribacillus sp. TH16]MBK5501568.1 NAD(P)-binding protein [Peribacillus sp. TH14]WMX53503.1 NAD(P)-binding protein [Peribacillus sp. R9-11]
MYPITLNIENRKCIIIGGGKIAYFKAGPLLEAGAEVTVVSPEICEGFQKLQEEGKIHVLLKEVEETDYKDAFLIIAATNSSEINEQVYKNTSHSQLVNVISNQELGNFHIPATLNRGKLTISVSTNGASPKLAKKIRNDLQEVYDESYEEYLEFLFEVRMHIKKSSLSKDEKSQLLKDSIEDIYKYSLKERYRFLARLLPVETEYKSLG